MKSPEYEALVNLLAGPPWSYTEIDHTRLKGLLLSRLFLPLIEQTGSPEFDQSLFERLYRTVEQALTKPVMTYVEWQPIIGLHADVAGVQLDESLLLRQMSKTEIMTCLATGALPMRQEGDSGYRLSPNTRWALVHESTYPLSLNHNAPLPKCEPHLSLAASEFLITTLRLVGGGRVFAGNGFSQITFPWKYPYSASPDLLLTMVILDSQYHDEGRPCRIQGNVLTELSQLWDALHDQHVQHDDPLRIALRRLRTATLRPTSEDVLIDLMISAEALFGQGSGEGELTFRIPLGSALLIEPPDTTNREAIRDFFRNCYGLRSDILHGREPKKRKKGLNGASASMEEIVSDLDGLMRLALEKAVRLKASGSEYHWDIGSRLLDLGSVPDA